MEDAAVEIDVRAELSIAEVNLQRIDVIAGYLRDQRERFQEYQRRLRSIAGRPVEPYPLEDATLNRLPVAGADALGLLVSAALHEPARRFDSDPPDPSAGDEEK